MHDHSHRPLLEAFVIVGLFLIAQGSAWPDSFITSPDQKLKITLAIDPTGHLTFAANLGGIPIVAASPLGIFVDEKDLGSKATLGVGKFSEINEEYPLLGAHSIAKNHGNETDFPVTGGSAKTAWMLEVRAYDDGFAFRYRVPGSGSRIINGEATAWNFPSDARVWYQNDTRSYEGVYTETTIGELKPNTQLLFPTTLHLSGGPYLAITEANLISYSDMGVSAQADHGLKAVFYADPKGWSTDGEILSPWRVTIVAPELNTLVNSDIVHNLCPPPSDELAHADWIKPGRCCWQWWNSGAPKLLEQHQWIDWTKQLGFEYYLIDEGWKPWKSEEGKDQWACLKETVEYAKTQGVGIFIWVDYREVSDAAKRDAYFQEAKDCDVVGLKIDFPPKGSIEIVNWYTQTLQAAANQHFLIDFHGAIKPTGLDRTWPNEINREGIRGHEYHINRYHRTLAPSHDTILPFTRYLAGHADYTPTAFNPAELRGYTWSRELAQAVVFTSPFLCYADHPKFYLSNPALDVLRAIPATWDETIVLPGSEIGKIVGFARRKGDSWFIGVMNGAEPSTLHIDLGFLGAKKYNLEKLEDVPGKDADLKRSDSPVSASDHLVLDLRPSGGFVGWLKPE